MFLLFGGADGCFTFFYFFLRKRFTFCLLFFTFSLRIWSRGGVRTPWNFGKFEFRKKIQVFFVVAIFIVTTVWLQGDYRAKYGKMNLSNFQESLTLFWRSHSFLRKSTHLFIDIFQRQCGYCWRQPQKSQFSHREIIISVFFISITIRCTTA